MSKDPYCAKYHANSPAQLELVVVGKNSGLENVVLYLSQGLSADAANQKSSRLNRYSTRKAACTSRT